MDASCDFSSLDVLLKASSKEQVIRICNDVFLCGTPISNVLLESVCETLGTRPNQTKQMLMSLSSVLRTIVFHGYTEAKEVHSIFPKDFHKNLRDLLTKISLDNANNWKNHAINNQVSLPRLTDFDWRVDTKMASDTISRMSVPTCILQMKVQENPTDTSESSSVQSVNVELSKETLDTMLDGLSKIRDQLSSVAKR